MNCLDATWATASNVCVLKSEHFRKVQFSGSRFKNQSANPMQTISPLFFIAKVGIAVFIFKVMPLSFFNIIFSVLIDAESKTKNRNSNIYIYIYIYIYTKIIANN